MPERWFSPAYLPNQYLRDYSSAAWGAYFTDSHVLDSVLPLVDVWNLYWPLTYSGGPGSIENIGSWQQHLAPILAAAGVKSAFSLSFAISGIGTGASIAAADVANFNTWISYGGTVDYVSIGAFPGTFFYDGTGAWQGHTQAQANAELTAYLTGVRPSFPNIKFGLEIQPTNWPYNGAKAYSGATVSSTLPDMKGIIDGLAGAAITAGVPLEFAQCDAPYSYLCKYHTSLGDATVDFIARLSAIKTQLATYSMRFGMQYTSEEPGFAGDDPRWYWESVDMHDRLLATLNPDQIIPISFYPGPHAMLPIEQPYTYSNMYRAIVSGTPQRSPSGNTSISATAAARGRREGPIVFPVWRLSKGVNGPFITTWDINARNVIMNDGTGWSLDGIAYYASNSPVFP